MDAAGTRSSAMLSSFDAAIFDLDGVVTRTARIHAMAWKQTFDELLRARAAGDGDLRPFDIDTDYVQHVDGRPREGGVRCFLASRGIALPEGRPGDGPDAATVHGLGNRKNALFQELLARQGVQVYDDAVRVIRALRERGARVAVATSSKNAALVLGSAGLADLFEACVDGVVSAELGLAGKPSPDIFLEAARRLGVAPGRAILFEDAVAGVRAGKRGGFGLVVGVDRVGQAAVLRESGADVVISSFEHAPVDRLDAWFVQNTRGLPSALASWSALTARLRGRRAAVFLDYDGTLAPIVAQPEQAFMPAQTRDVVRRLAGCCPTAVVSGRARDKVVDFVQLDELYYAGSHGFDISGPGESIQWQQDPSLRQRLQAASARLRAAVAGIDGVLVEEKGFATAVHYRQVAPGRVPELEKRVEEVLAGDPDLEKTHGKKVMELRPRVDWNKGRAVLWLLDALDLDSDDVLPIYVGDDVTDEDAFEALQGRGLGILVSERPRPSAAAYAVRDPGEVCELLARLVAYLSAPDSPGSAPDSPGDEPAAAAGSAWKLVYEGFEPRAEPLREALCTLGNGYFATRGASEHVRADDVHYPGTYLAGGYDRMDTEIAGRVITNEDFVNFPNWLRLPLRVEDGDWLNVRSVELLAYRQELDMRQGLLSRRFVFRDRAGRETEVASRRLVHMGQPHLAGLELAVTPRNWSGHLTLRSELDGSVINAGVERYRQLGGKHLEIVGMGEDGDDVVWLEARTRQSHILVAEAARTRISGVDEPRRVERATVREDEVIGQELRVPVEQGRTVRVEKIVTLYSSRDWAISEPATDAREVVREAGGFDELLASHAQTWRVYWDRYDIDMEPADGELRMLRLHIFHLLQTVSANSVDRDVGVPARGLHGEAYRGHVFWDELFIFPFYNLRTPEITRSLLLYRYRRLDRARALAREAGHAGAMYPWQSGSSGREETQIIHLNPRSGRWAPDHSRLQRHVNIAIAYNLWSYWETTGDEVFLAVYGSEMLLEIARFWSSIATLDPETGRYHVRGVMGPDEYHEQHPDSERPGVDDNAYTNIMVVWLLERALLLLDMLAVRHRLELCRRLDIGAEELARWHDITRKMYVPFHGNGIISQLAGYERLTELPWDAYRQRYGDIARLDRILEAEGDTPDRYQVSKQADVLMLFYLLPPDRLARIFAQLGYAFDDDLIRRNVAYYMARTSHGSTLSRVVHASVLDRLDRDRAWTLFREALRSDIEDVQGGTTQEGIHLGAMAGTVDIVLRHYAGVRVRDSVISFDPALPAAMTRLRFKLRHRDRWYRVELTSTRFVLEAEPARGGEVTVRVRDRSHTMRPGDRIAVDL